MKVLTCTTMGAYPRVLQALIYVISTTYATESIHTFTLVLVLERHTGTLVKTWLGCTVVNLRAVRA